MEQSTIGIIVGIVIFIVLIISVVMVFVLSRSDVNPVITTETETETETKSVPQSEYGNYSEYNSESENSVEYIDWSEMEITLQENAGATGNLPVTETGNLPVTVPIPVTAPVTAPVPVPETVTETVPETVTETVTTIGTSNKGMPYGIYISSISPSDTTTSKYVTTGNPYYALFNLGSTTSSPYFTPSFKSDDFSNSDIIRAYIGLLNEQKYVFLVPSSNNKDQGRFYIGVNGTDWDYRTNHITDTNILNYTGKWSSRVD